MQAIQPVILAGGSGSRLWPVSRPTQPKQLLELIGEGTLLHETVQRLEGLSGQLPLLPPVIVVGKDHLFSSKGVLYTLQGAQGCRLVLEPIGTCTGPALCGVVEYIKRNNEEDNILLVLPSDHLIGKPETFSHAIESAVKIAEQGKIVTFGVVPSRPEPGYGYIEMGPAGEVLSFTEKPSMEEISSFVDDPAYLWNSGMLTFRIDVFQQEMQSHAPRMQECMIQAVENGSEEDECFSFDPQTMKNVEDTSIDYALMEKTRLACVVPVDLDWTDIGSWQALWEAREKDDQNNVCQGDVLLEEVEGCLIHSEGRLVAALGLKNLVVVETPDAVLVADISESQRVKQLVKKLKAARRQEARFSKVVNHPWGSYVQIEKRPDYSQERLSISPGEEISLHGSGSYRHLLIVGGEGTLDTAGTSSKLKRGQHFNLPDTQVTLKNTGKEQLEILVVKMKLGSE